MSSENQEIIIDLNSDLDELLNSENSNLQVRAMDKLERLLTRFKDNIPKDNSDDKNLFRDFRIVRRTNTIYIQGSRGAGKTTFLRYVLNKYHSKKDSDIKSVAFIDPTLISTHQHVLTEIIAKIDSRVMGNGCCYDIDEKFIKNWKKCLDNIAEGIELLSTPSHTKNDHDTSWFLTKALQNAKSGQGLEDNLHKLIDLATEQLGAKLLLIAIDDVDTQTTKAYEVLELIRCYLTHPKLVIILSGDLELYSHIVQQNKYNEITFNEKLTPSHKLLNHLEEQYLVKVLPVHQRINLENMYEIVNNMEGKLIKVKYSNKGDGDE